MTETVQDDQPSVWPTELRLLDDGRLLSVKFDTGEAVELTSEYLRVESPSAEVQGHGPGQKVLVCGKANVRITGIEPIGNYAVRLVFDDGHASGLYSWEYLHKLGRDHEELWQKYLTELEQQALSRHVD